MLILLEMTYYSKKYGNMNRKKSINKLLILGFCRLLV